VPKFNSGAARRPTNTIGKPEDSPTAQSSILHFSLNPKTRFGKQQATILVRQCNYVRKRESSTHGDSSPSRNQTQLSWPLLGPLCSRRTALAAIGPRPRHFRIAGWHSHTQLNPNRLSRRKTRLAGLAPTHLPLSVRSHPSSHENLSFHTVSYLDRPLYYNGL
jgi:hypothetical protein